MRMRSRSLLLIPLLSPRDRPQWKLRRAQWALSQYRPRAPLHQLRQGPKQLSFKGNTHRPASTCLRSRSASLGMVAPRKCVRGSVGTLLRHSTLVTTTHRCT